MRTLPFRMGLLLLSLVVSVIAIACGDDDSGPAPLTHDVWIVGQVYDGAQGTRLTGYTLAVTYRDVTLPGEIASDGRFLVRRLPVFQDYTVEIKAEGYRPFRSHNGMFNLPNPGNQSSPTISSTQTFYFDAYLFPTSLQTPEVTLTIRKGTTTGELAAGTARLRPISASALADTTAETPAGVGAQLWGNDEDLQAKPLTKTFNEGNITIAPGELVYGVKYLLSVYDVKGYQPFEGQITAGVDGTKTFVVQQESADPLTLTQTNAAACRTATSSNDTSGSVVVFEFSTDIAFAPNTMPGGFAELIDDGFTITSSNTNADAGVNALATDVSSTVQEHGTTSSIAGRYLTLQWNPSLGLATKDPGDVITQSRWNINGVQIEPVGRPAQRQSLSTFNPGGTTITCN